MKAVAAPSPCPQACGKLWPACGCLTAEQKEAEAAKYQMVGRRRRRVKKIGETAGEMMTRLSKLKR